MIVLDANVVIAFLDESDAHHEAAVGLLERRFHDGFGASVLTIAEALVHPTRVGRETEALRALTNIGVAILPLAAEHATGLAHIRSAYNVRMPDAVALHAAATATAELATFDESLRAAAARAGIAFAQ